MKALKTILKAILMIPLGFLMAAFVLFIPVIPYKWINNRYFTKAQS